MATSVKDFSEKKKKKRKRKGSEKTNGRKLLVGEKVEVRSVEEGFCGSWHSATVIACGDSVREVRYENLLRDDGTDNLTEFISVPSMIEGVIPEKGVPLNHRGLIRPLVQGEKVCKLGLYYGLCVDALIDDAWWEGVIFDYEDGSEKRLVFFPDLGDEVEVEIEHIRITRVWDEVEENWNTRGTWLFLEWLEKYEEEWPILVSMKQIWYELRAKEDFQMNIKDWTYCVESMWEDLVMEVIQDNLYLTADHFLNIIHSEIGINWWIEGTSKRMRERENLIERPNKRTKILIGSSNRNPCVPTVETQLPFASSAEPLESCSVKHKVVPAQNVPASVKQLEECNITQLVSGEPLGQLGAPLVENRERCSINNTVQISPHLEKVDALNKAPLTNTHFLCEVLDFSAAVSFDVNHGEGEDQEPRRIVDDTRHYKGCRNNTLCDDPIHNSPCSNLYLSHGKKDSVNNALSKEDDSQGVGNVSRISEDAICLMDNDQPESSKLRQNIHWLPAGKDMLPKPKYCPEALSEYLFSRKRISDVRMHLLQLGWNIEYHTTKTNNVKFRYTSPKGTFMYSVRNICRLLSQQTEMGDTLTSRNGCPTLVEDASGDHLKSSHEQVLPSKTLEQPQGCDSDPFGEAQTVGFSNREVGFLGDSFHHAQMLNSHISEKEVVPVVPGGLSVKEYHPQAVLDLIAYKPGRKMDGWSDINLLRLKARKHLSAHGWTVRYFRRKGRNDGFRFISPMKRSYISLRQACEGHLKEEGLRIEQMKGMLSDKERVNDKFSSAVRLNSEMRKTNTESSGSSLSRENLKFGSVQHKRAMKSPRKQCPSSLFHAKLLRCQPNHVQGTSGSSWCIKNLEFGNAQDERAGRNHLKRKKLSSFLQLQRSKSALLSGRRIRNAKRFCYNGMKRCLVSWNAGSRELKKLRGSGALMEQIDQLVSYPARILRSSKREQQVVASNPAHGSPRSVLSWLIDNNILLPRAKAHYLSRKGHHPMAEGRITRNGIKCNCCRKVYGLSSFESHAGSNSKRPSANIFLEDGRSLLDCQKQVVQSNNLKGFTQEPHKRIKCNQPHKDNDYICSVCHYGGNLVLCDQCPSSFHLNCLGLEDLPKGKWFCPSCRCGICGQSEFNGNTKQFTEKTVLYCDQCRHEYHVGCIRKRGQSKLESRPQRSWFCSKKCEKIFVNLHKVLGTSTPVGVDNLSWTILKSLKDGHDFGAPDIEAITENQMKLNVALAVVHDSFEPMKEPRTKRDIVKDVLFNNISELNRLNFWGFYTVILEREDEIISVATVRIHGEKVAEIPLICTCVQYRGRGMSRILLNVLEKKLAELEVERLFLPAVPQVLQTWTGHFGFSKVERSERLEFLQYTFLDFQDTTMCQKMIRMTHAAKSTELRARDELRHIKENTEMIRHNSIPEVIQSEQIELSEKLDQLPLRVAEKVLQVKNMLKCCSFKELNQQMPEAGIAQKCMLKNGESDNQQNCDDEKCSQRSSNDKIDNISEKCTVRSSDKMKENHVINGFLVYRRKRTAVRYSEGIAEKQKVLTDDMYFGG